MNQDSKAPREDGEWRQVGEGGSAGLAERIRKGELEGQEHFVLPTSAKKLMHRKDQPQNQR